MKRFVFLIVLASTTAFAYQPAPVASVDFGVPVFGGPGCPGTGTLKVLDQTKMIYQLDFDGFVVEVGGGVNRSLDRKICTIAIPAKVNSGVSIAVSKLQYAGFNDLNGGATSKVSTEAFFAGSRSPMIQKQFSATGEFSEDVNLSAAEKSWSPCGASTNLRLSISDEIKTTPGQAQSLSKIDGKLIFQLEVQRCS